MSRVLPSTDHGSFVIERTFTVPLARVFSAWSDPARKRRWNVCHDDWQLVRHELDFREGGAETNESVEPDGTVHTMRARYFDIVPEARIVYAYEMQLDEVRISVSLVTVTFAHARGTTTMTFTEHVTFLDGHGDLDERRRGTELGLLRLPEVLGEA